MRGYGFQMNPFQSDAFIKLKLMSILAIFAQNQIE